MLHESRVALDYQRCCVIVLSLHDARNEMHGSGAKRTCPRMKLKILNSPGGWENDAPRVRLELKRLVPIFLCYGHCTDSAE